MRNLISVIFFLIIITNNLFANTDNIIEVKKVLELEINSSINPATYNYIKEGIKKAQNNYQMILIRLNTPGGLVSTTKDIITALGEIEIPTAIWITPEGASATSAGAIISSSAHFLFMSEGTNIGAATPVQMGNDIKQDDLRKKAINDLVALVESLSEARGRNGAAFKEMIDKASSFDTTEALKKNIINAKLNYIQDLGKIINGKKVKIKGVEFTISSNQIVFEKYEMDLGQKLLNIFANPNLAYLFFIVGAALIYLELQAPGGMIAGSIGAIFLVLAGISFQVLPLNFGALALIALSFLLFILEIYITSFGILSLGGLASLFFGSSFLFRTSDSYLNVATHLIYSTMGSVIIFMAIITYFIVKDLKNRDKEDYYTLVGETGEISGVQETSDKNEFEYEVKVNGERWKALSNKKYELGQKIKIQKQDIEHMKLYI